jgi:hypothetical protein
MRQRFAKSLYQVFSERGHRFFLAAMIASAPLPIPPPIARKLHDNPRTLRSARNSAA